jgi:archaellum biogenesis ATPase FlaH
LGGEVSERKLLASCIKSREAFERVQSHLGRGDVSDQGDIILSAVRDYYARDDDITTVDPDLLRADVGRRVSSSKHQELFGNLIGELVATEVSPANVVHDFIAVKREVAGAALAGKLASGSDPSVTRPLLEEYIKWDTATQLEEENDEILNGVTATELTSQIQEEGLIEIWPTSLNNRLDGGLLRGHHLLIFARPEMGKTLVVVNMIAGFCAQGLRTLYIGNEEPVEDTMLRVQSRLTGFTKHEILDDPDFTDQILEERGYDLIYFKEAAPGTPSQIQRWIDAVQPDVLVIDQIRNLNVNEEHFVQKLEKAASAARNLGKFNNCLVVSITQAGDSASGKAVLDMGDVDSSNTGIPATVDVMVGLGATADDEAMLRRVISLPKNKRSGRHEFFPVRIEPTISNIRSLQ